MDKNAVIRLDNIMATHDGSLLKSVRISEELQNGSVVEIGGLVEGEREIHETAVPKVDSKYFGILCTPELMYDEKKAIDEFVNVTEKPARAFIPHLGDIFSLTAEGFNTVPKVGQFVELAASNTLAVADAATDGSTQVGKIIEIDVVGRYTFYVIEVM